MENGQWLFLFAIFIGLHFEMILRNSKSDNGKKTGKTWIKKSLWVNEFRISKKRPAETALPARQQGAPQKAGVFLVFRYLQRPSKALLWVRIG